MSVSTTRKHEGEAASSMFRFLLTHRRHAQGFREALGVDEATSLTMLWIPPGRFWMGSPEDELKRRSAEGPQHLVQLQGFFLSQTPITQAQWREVAIWRPSNSESAGFCPACDYTDSRVLESRAADDGGSMHRIRECLNCDLRFTTYEVRMQCPNCQNIDSRVLENRAVHKGLSIRRRRECLNCDFRFTTYELQVDSKSSFLNPEPSLFQGDQRPVVQVSWEDAMEFCHRLSQRNGRNYTLPSEAQWEYACRAGTISPFHFGSTISTKFANYDGTKVYGDSEKGMYRQETVDVASFPANPWGLHDMHGNVREWCADHWHGNYEGAADDGRAWIVEKDKEIDNIMKFRLLRGGSWSAHPESCRSAFRNLNPPDYRDDDIGFRVCCVPQD
jgi:formylglycine-generating enzyme required for sulfatase activity